MEDLRTGRMKLNKSIKYLRLSILKQNNIKSFFRLIWRKILINY